MPGSILGFDPSIYVEYVTDPANPDYAIGFRAYADTPLGPWKSGGVLVDPYTKDNIRTEKDSKGNEYRGAEVTSKGFHIYGLDPYQYYSAGYACYLSDISLQQDSWDIWDNHAPVANVRNGHIIGYKYFGFGGLGQNQKGLKAFEGTKPGNNTVFNFFLTPKTTSSFKVSVWLDGPWSNATWKGKKIGEIHVPVNSAQVTTQFMADVSAFVDQLNKKHAIYLVAESTESGDLFDFIGLGFNSKDKKIARPVVPKVNIQINGKVIEFPATPVRSTNANGIVGYNLYEATYKLAPYTAKVPVVSTSANQPDVKVTITQATSPCEMAMVQFDYRGVVKTYRIVFIKE